MKLFCAQVASVWEDPEATLEKVEPCIARASRGGGDLVCFPEQFATGWDPESAMHVQDLDGPVVRRMRALAEEYSIGILGSFREATASFPRNTCVVVSADGNLCSTYSKCHLFSPAAEDRHFSRGNTIATFSIGGMEIGLAICYDLRFTSLFRLYADAGVQAVLVPAAWPEARLQHWELFIRARALEYQIYVAGINTTGMTPVDCYAGGSMVADPSGALLFHAGREEVLLSCELDREYVERVRSAFPVTRDRRDDLAPFQEQKRP
ncbi:MAG: carbon-nitrogen hydrolase family protein [Methanolinea sp.]|jgi:predicted amidohydrolase|nr:carbon-nitrogen hydrolase family protein [Methanolinea sp.]